MRVSDAEAINQTTGDTMPSSNAESSSDVIAPPVAPASEAEIMTQSSGDSVPCGNIESVSDASAEPITPACEEEAPTQSTGHVAPENMQNTRTGCKVHPQSRRRRRCKKDSLCTRTGSAVPFDNTEFISDASAEPVMPACEGEVPTRPTAVPSDNTEFISDASAEPVTPACEEVPPQSTAVPSGNTESISDASAESVTPACKEEVPTKPTAVPSDNTEFISDASVEPVMPTCEEEVPTKPTAVPSDNTEFISDASVEPVMPTCEEEVPTQSTAMPSGNTESISDASAEPVMPTCEAEVPTQSTVMPSSDAASSSDVNAPPVVPASEMEVMTQPSSDSVLSGNPEFISEANAEPVTPACEAEVATQSTAVPSSNAETRSDVDAPPAALASEAEVLTQPSVLPSGKSKSSPEKYTSPEAPAIEIDVITQSSGDSSLFDTPVPTSAASTSIFTPAFEGEATTQPTTYDHDDKNSVEAVEKPLHCITPEMMVGSKDKLKMESALEFLITKITSLEQTIQQQGENIKRLETTTTKINEITESQTMSPTFTVQSDSGSSASSLVTVSETEVNIKPTTDLSPSSTAESKLGASASPIVTVSETEETIEPTADSFPNRNSESTSDSSDTTAAFEKETFAQPSGDCQKDEDEESEKRPVDQNIQSIDPNLVQYIIQELTKNINGKLTIIESFLSEQICSINQMANQQDSEITNNQDINIPKEEAHERNSVREAQINQEDENEVSGEVQNIQSIELNLVQYIIEKVNNTIQEKLINIEWCLQVLRDQIMLSIQWINRHINNIINAKIIKTEDIQHNDTNIAEEGAEEITYVGEDQINSIVSSASPSSTTESTSDVSVTFVTPLSHAEATTLPTDDLPLSAYTDSNSGATASSMTMYSVPEVTSEPIADLSPPSSVESISSASTFTMTKVSETGVSIEPTPDLSSSGDAVSNSFATASSMSFTRVPTEPPAQSSSTSRNSRTHNRSPPLTFHRVRGGSINISEDGSTVRKVNGTGIEYVYSARPVNIGEKVSLLLLEVKDSDPWFAVGFTNREPMSSVTYSNHRDHWMKVLDRNFRRKGTLISYYVNAAGEVRFEINGEDKGILVDGVNIHAPLWVCLVIVTDGTTFQLVDPRSAAQTETVDSSGELTSEMKILNFNKLHLDSEINYVSYAFIEKPLGETHMIIIKILKVEKRRFGSLSIGVTSCDPKTLESSKLPDDPEMLKHRPEHWEVCSDVVNDLEVDEELEVTMTVDREIQISRNGAPALTVMHISNSGPLWMFVYTYGATQQTRALTRRPIISSFYSKTTTTLEHGNIIAGKRTSSMTPAFGKKATFQSPFDDLSTSLAQDVAKVDQVGAECIICKEEPVNSVLYRCGHMWMCLKCARKQLRVDRTDRCRTCREQRDVKPRSS